MDTCIAGLEVGRPPRSLSTLWTIAWREVCESARARWFSLYTLAFAVLGLGVSFLSSAAAGGAGLSGFGRTSAGLVNLVLLVVPLMAITAGAGSLAGERERGSLAYLLAQPVARWEVLLGKFVGLAIALAACISIGLGSCACVLAWRGGGAGASSLALLAALSLALAMTMLSVGMLISVMARRASVAVGVAVFLWLTLVFVTDLGLMAGALTMRLRVEHVFWLSVANPLQAFKMWSLHALDASIDVLGPAGLYAMDTYEQQLAWILAGILAAWVVGPLALASAAFSRSAVQ